MRTIRKGSKGEAVAAWQSFLRGQGYPIVADGDFGPATHEATCDYQTFKGLMPDGIVGPKTYEVAGIGRDDDFPPRPAGLAPLTSAERERIFGKFSYVPAGVPVNTEAIKITDDWARENIVKVNVQQLRPVSGAPTSGGIYFHRRAERQLQELFRAWSRAGKASLILSWGGSWVPRFVRGSRTTLSNHSWGTAFDINVQWNPLGTAGAPRGAKGSVRELVEIAVDHGFYWGGWFSRRDPMHFEVCEVK